MTSDNHQFDEHGRDEGQRSCCPTCGKPTRKEARPFCSIHCKQIDLGRWLTGAYVISGGRTDEEAETVRDDGDRGEI